MEEEDLQFPVLDEMDAELRDAIDDGFLRVAVTSQDQHTEWDRTCICCNVVGA